MRLDLLLSAVERNAVVVRKQVLKAQSVLRAAEHTPVPLQYHQAKGALADLLPVWLEHLRLLSQAAPLISRETDRMAIAVLRQFEEDIADTASSLEVTSSAGWARTPELGINSLRLSVRATLRNILCHLEIEQTTIMPLLRRGALRKAEPVPAVRQMATA